MNFMSLFRSIAPITLSTLLLLAPAALRAQQSAPPPPPDTPSAVPNYPPPPSYPDDSWVPQGMETFSRHASFHTDFTFDPEMLRLASDFTGDDDTRRIIARLRGISVHIYRYPEPDLYNPAWLDIVRSQYRARGWQHLVTAHANPVSDNPGTTDLWIRFEHANVEGMVLLIANPTNIDLIAVNGTLSPLDILHLRGHFGIPRFPGNRFENDNNYSIGHNNPPPSGGSSRQP